MHQNSKGQLTLLALRALQRYPSPWPTSPSKRRALPPTPQTYSLPRPGQPSVHLALVTRVLLFGLLEIDLATRASWTSTGERCVYLEAYVWTRSSCGTSSRSRSITIAPRGSSGRLISSLLTFPGPSRVQLPQKLLPAKHCFMPSPLLSMLYSKGEFRRLSLYLVCVIRCTEY